MKKVVLAVISAFILTGCTAEYNLDLTESKPIEEMTITENNTNDTYFEYLKNYSEYVPAIYDSQDPDIIEYDPEKEYYEMSNLSTDNRVNLNLNHTFNNNSIKNSNIIKTCYENVELDNNDTNINIKTSRKFLCFDKYITLESVKINIKTDKKIVNHNADSVNNNTYTWIITPNNKDHKPIIMTSIDENSNTSNESDDLNTKLKIILITLGAFIVVIIGIIIYKTKKYNSN